MNDTTPKEFQKRIKKYNLYILITAIIGIFYLIKGQEVTTFIFKLFNKNVTSFTSENEIGMTWMVILIFLIIIFFRLNILLWKIVSKRNEEAGKQKLKELSNKSVKTKNNLYKALAETEVSIENNSRANKLKSEINRCKKLHEKGLISDEEYNNRFKEIIAPEKFLFDKYITPSVVAKVLYTNNVISKDDFEFTINREGAYKEIEDENDIESE